MAQVKGEFSDEPAAIGWLELSKNGCARFASPSWTVPDNLAIRPYPTVGTVLRLAAEDRVMALFRQIRFGTLPP